ncbi:Right handed beta helix region [Micromonospora purpureochromogenes]|uniref:Right handed beta helix region n=1 Tax=Micromonospora purpureochromogenes TaxID=47872 RepID=A0A1C5A916_9ACTN|nr:Right handed beta helix region [Micromonospora purpureochromogenes]
MQAAATGTLVSSGESIQAALDAAPAGGTVLVEPGTYLENLTFRGKDVTLKSTGGPSVTLLDGGGVAPAVRFTGGETRAARVEGFTIRHGGRGPAEWPYPEGAVWSWYADPSIVGNVVEQTRLCGGGAIYAEFSAPLIENNIIRDNAVDGCYYPYGGGISIQGDDNPGIPLIRGNTIERNKQHNGGGIGLYAAGRVRIEHNIIRDNEAIGGEGGGIALVNANAVELVGNLIEGNNKAAIGGSLPSSLPGEGLGLNVVNNTIVSGGGPAIDLWYAAPVQIAGSALVAGAGSPVLRCRGPLPDPWGMTDSLVWNGRSAPLYEGESGPCGVAPGAGGVVDADPAFVAAGSDFRVRPESAAVDAGYPVGDYWLTATDLAGAPRVTDGNGDGVARIDMGAYETGPGGTSPPGAPEALQLRKSGSSITARWSPPAYNGGAAVTGYEVTLEPGGRFLTLPAGTTTATFSGLSRKTTYTVTVRAVNSAGAGAAATASIRL